MINKYVKICTCKIFWFFGDSCFYRVYQNKPKTGGVFLDVGQGDVMLVILVIRFLDGGPSNKISAKL